MADIQNVEAVPQYRRAWNGGTVGKGIHDGPHRPPAGTWRSTVCGIEFRADGWCNWL